MYRGVSERLLVVAGVHAEVCVEAGKEGISAMHFSPQGYVIYTGGEKVRFDTERDGFCTMNGGVCTDDDGI